MQGFCIVWWLRSDNYFDPFVGYFNANIEYAFQTLSNPFPLVVNKYDVCSLMTHQTKLSQYVAAKKQKLAVDYKAFITSFISKLVPTVTVCNDCMTKFFSVSKLLPSLSKSEIQVIDSEDNLPEK